MLHLRMTRQNVIPSFFLYDEALADVDLDFLHVEAIRIRSSVHDWTIRPHAHPEHVQFLFMTEGGGRIRVEDDEWQLDPPTVVVIPPTAVHEIRFEPGSDGFALTIAASYVTAMAQTDPAFADVPAAAGLYPAQGPDGDGYGLLDAFQWLEREFIGAAPGRRAAIGAHFLRVLVALARLKDGGAPAGGPLMRRDADIVVRYRRLIEEHFRQAQPLTFYADGLNITYARLNAACRAVAGKSALKLMHDRLMIEAKRNLLYTSMSVGEVGHAVGFQDPAYFSRFFTRHAGRSPAAFRAAPR